jgi:acetylornithine deacetylase
MKPTQWHYPGGGVNQIPAECTVCGDCRLTPFYSAEKAANSLKSYVDTLNKDINQLPKRGPVSKYTLPDQNITGTLELTIMGEKMSGVACSIESDGHKVLVEATAEVLWPLHPKP